MKKESHLYARKHIFSRLVVLVLGVFIMTFVIALSLKAGLGTSPISTVPYVVNLITGYSVGIATIIMNTGFILIQALLLRERFEKIQLFQFPLVLCFGTLIDVHLWLLTGAAPENYFWQWAYCLAGLFFLALGITLEVSARLVMTAGEGIVLAVCMLFPVKFGTMKVVFDVLLVVIAVTAALFYFGSVEGAREGTLALALFTGVLTRTMMGPVEEFERRHLF